MKQTKTTIESIASRNEEVVKVYDDLKTIIETYDTQVKSLAEQLKTYGDLGEKASSMFEVAEKGFSDLTQTINSTNEDVSKGVEEFGSTIQKALNTQAETMAELTGDIKNQLPDSLGELEKTLTGLTEKFAEDYESFLKKVQNLGAAA